MNRLAFLLLAMAACVGGADWVTDRGDAERSGWQRREKQLSTETVPGIQLLWKKTLANGSSGLDSVSTPVMLGPIFTHRGIKELVFVTGTADNVFAVDADLGRIYWARTLEVHIADKAESTADCGAGVMAAPVISPPPGSDSLPEDETEPRTPLRPIFVVSSDGYLHQIRPSTGQDMKPPRKFLQPGMKVAQLTLVDGVVYAQATCGDGTGERWSIAANGAEDEKPKRVDVSPSAALLDARQLSASGFAAAQDHRGQRWIYATRAGIEGFRVLDEGGKPLLQRMWESAPIAGLLPPVVANGVIYALASGETTAARSGHAVLYALDAATGKMLYTSGDVITSFVHSSGLALANGHICFGTGNNTLYCFGLPLEI